MDMVEKIRMDNIYPHETSDCTAVESEVCVYPLNCHSSAVSVTIFTRMVGVTFEVLYIYYVHASKDEYILD